jgi:hypothetical protein
MRILARIQEMAAQEILSYIPADVYQRIKDTDDTPVFRAYVVGHEGVSGGKIVGEGEMVKHWYASAINKLYDKLKAGLKIFHGHAATNEHAGRMPIGELVGKTLKDIGDRLTAIAITYIKPEFRHLPLDVASIEANLYLHNDAGIADTDVGDVTGIALGNSAVNIPGFAGATLLAQIQGFAREYGQRSTRFQRTGGDMEFSIDDVRQFIKANKVRPSDLFGVETLTDDPAVKGFVETERTQAKSGEYAHRKRHEEEFDKQKKEWETKMADLQKQLNERSAEIAKANVPALFVKLAGERKLTEKQTKFIEKRLKRFTPTAPDKVEAELVKHLDAELDEFKETAEVLGIVDAGKTDAGKADAGKTKSDGGTGPDERGSAGEMPDKYLNPETNPFIPKV